MAIRLIAFLLNLSVLHSAFAFVPEQWEYEGFQVHPLAVKTPQKKMAVPEGTEADRALFLIGAASFAREDYAQAERAFDRIIAAYPKSEFRPRCFELTITAKAMQPVAGPLGRRRLLSARCLIEQFRREEPKLAAEKEDFLDVKLVGIRWKLAEYDFQQAMACRQRGEYLQACCRFYLLHRTSPGTGAGWKAGEELPDSLLLLLRQWTGCPIAP